jgi:hypothetical protein
MSKFFMYGTELQELEQLMMLVPNFIPRRSGVIVVKKVEKKKEAASCEECGYPVSNNFNETDCICFTKKLVGKLICYEDIVESCYKECGLYHLNRRLDQLVNNFDGEIFLNPIHRSRFHTVCRLQNVSLENRNPIYLATLFLLTADDKLWCAAKEHIYLDSVDFKSMHLNGINTDGYALYQTARTIYFGREYIKPDEIADNTLIGEQTFKAIINATLLSRYGAEILQVNC